MLNRFAMAVVLAAGLGLVGCNNGGDNTSSSTTGTSTGTAAGGDAGKSGGKTYKIAVIPKGSTHEFWKAVHAGANDAAEKFGATIDFNGPHLENDRSSQQDMVENKANGDSDAIVLAPLDSKALVKPVEAAIAKNKPVVVIDSGLDSTKISSFVATDNEKGGAMAADEMIKRLNGKGKVVVLRYGTNSASTEAREKGFEDEIKAKGTGIQIVNDKLEAGPTIETAQKSSESLLQPLKGPDGKLTIDGIFCPNESSTAGMLLTLKENKWAGTVKFMGFDSSQALIDGLKGGFIDGLILQNPYKIGFEGVHQAVRALKKDPKDPVETKIDTGATLITKDNMDANKDLLSPKQA